MDKLIERMRPSRTERELAVYRERRRRAAQILSGTDAGMCSCEGGSHG